LVKTRPKYTNQEFIKDLWYFIGKRKKEFIGWSIILTIGTLLGLAGPIILAEIINFFTNNTGQSISVFYILLGIYLGRGILYTIVRHTGKYFMALLTNKYQKELKVESFEKVIQNDLFWHEKQNTGEKIEKVSGGEKAIGNFMNFYINQGLGAIISLIAIIIIFSFFNIKYGIIAILFIIIYLAIEYIMNKKVAEKTLEAKIAKERASGKAFEFSSNISTIKSLGIESASSSQIARKEQKLLEAKKAKRKASTKKWVVVQLVAILFYSLFILLVGKDILAGAMTVGAIVIYIDYIRRLQETLNMISRESMNLINIKYSMYRLMQIYKAIPQIDESNTKDLKDWNEIKIKNLGFKYKSEEVLENFNLNLKKGQKLGIVGKSGSGKSTLFKLLLKLYLPKQGAIYFDNKPIESLTRDSILEKFSIVPQETELFNLSIKQNITISSQNIIDYDKYDKAIEASQLDSVIKKLKLRDLSLIGEKGIRLSGGERQRLGIARAIYKDSDIIIFDEATSNLDYETEKNIQKQLDKLENKTLIVSAHRLSTLQNMDQIIVLSKGKVIEKGTYKELINKKGYFYELWKKQERK